MAERTGAGSFRWRALALALAVLVGATALGAAASEAANDRANEKGQSVRVATTGNGSELVKTLPITRRGGAAKQVVMSMGPGTLPGLEKGDALRLTSEMQITVNCGFPSPRCVGPVYHYNPTIRARLIIANSRQTTGGPHALPVSKYDTDRCTQHKPDREHHCVLVFPNAGIEIRRKDQLPCHPDDCYVNLVADAHNRHAGAGDRVLVGGNRPDGSVPQDRSRINAIRYRGVSAPDFPSVSTHNQLISAIPPDFQRRVVFSQRLDDLEKREQLAVSAQMRTDITHVPYAVRTSARLILADSPTATTQGPYVKHVARLNGEISENNGFNCTQNKGTCLTRKVGVLEMRRDAVTGQGDPVPLFVNMVVVLGPKEVSASPGDRIYVTAGGIRVTRFPPNLNG